MQSEVRVIQDERNEWKFELDRLSPMTQDEGRDWLDAQFTALGSELDPDNQLYKPGGAPVARTAPVPARGSFGADTEPQTAQLLDKKIANMKATGADRLVVDCPGCVMQIRGGAEKHGLKIKVDHIAELLAENLKK